jgi:ADP-ribosyl-[dinitrogen reductase] hydrolase
VCSSGGAWPEFEGTLSAFLTGCAPIFEQARPARVACQLWYSGAFLLETMPSVLYILSRHAGDPEEAMIRAVNDTWDNDTIASIVGGALGALHGADAFPPRWIEGLLGRTRAEDDGRVFELIDAAVDAFTGA